MPFPSAHEATRTNRLRAPFALLLAAVLTMPIAGPAASTSARPTIVSPVAPALVSPVAPVAADGLPRVEAAGLPRAASGVPRFSHVYLIVMENHEYGSIVGASSAPYLNGLIAKYGLATNDHAVSHPSEPNYLALLSGSTQGVRDDAIHNFSGRSLVDQLAAKRLTWRVYAENVPLGCYRGATASGGVDGSGTYARKHEPAISFTRVSRSRARCANIANLSHFNAAAASFELIVPNMCHDMHDCSVGTGDSFLRRFVPKILRSAAFRGGGVLFITWDEGSTSLGGGGHVATLVIGPRVRAGFRSKVAHTHYSLLRTIEDAWGLGCLNRTCRSNDLREFFH